MLLALLFSSSFIAANDLTFSLFPSSKACEIVSFPWRLFSKLLGDLIIFCGFDLSDEGLFSSLESDDVLVLKVGFFAIFFQHL